MASPEPMGVGPVPSNGIAARHRRRFNSSPIPGRDRSGRRAPSTGVSDAVEQHPFDADVVVEILDVAAGAGRRSRGERAATGHSGRTATGCGPGTERRDLQKAGDAAAASRVGLQHVHGPGLEHAAEVAQVVSRIRRRRCPCPPARGRGAGAALPGRPRTRALRTSHAQVGKALGEGQGLLAAVGAVGVDKQLGFIADRRSGGPDAARSRRRDACRSSSSRAGCPRPPSRPAAPASVRCV